MKAIKANKTTDYKEFLGRFTSIYCLLFILSFPLKLHLIPDVSQVFDSFFESLIQFSAEHIFDLNQGVTFQIISDSTGMYVHLFNLMALSSISCLVWLLADRRKLIDRTWLYYLRTVLCYYISLQLLIYGFIKVFKWQFYLPEPNLLYTKLGDIPKNMLYWSTMGVSRAYVMAMGIIEVITGILLLFHQTRPLGALASAAVFINIVLINFGFDIDVKLFSLILMGFSLLIAYPFLRAIIFASWFQTSINLKTWRPSFEQNRLKYWCIKLTIILIIFIESTYPYFDTGNFNDDKAKRLKYHGAYAISKFNVNGHGIGCDNESRWKRIYIHRMHYLIIENEASETIDFEIQWDHELNSFDIKDYDGEDFHFHFTERQDSLRSLFGVMHGDTISAQLKPLNWRAMPLLQNEFNWTFDELK